VWGWLAFAIVCEVTATLCLRASEGFTRPIPSIIVIVGYAGAFYGLSRSLMSGMQIGQAYAVWAGVGVALVAAAGVALFGERLTAMQASGIAFIILGVVVLELGSTH
jgi:small multidrug resistance pump